MKLLRRDPSLLGLSVPKLAGLVILSFCFGARSVSPLAPLSNPPADDDIFQSPQLLRIAIEIREDGMDALRQSRSRQNSEHFKPKAHARVIEGGRTYTNVTVQLKGFSSFLPIDRLPSLTLNFDKLAPKQEFHGLTKISLNNSVQDPTRLHEKLSRELFAAAGVPVPRADHALVTLNGRELGLYVLTEGFDKPFLQRHFKEADGNLYEGGVLQDIDQALEFSSGRNPSNHAGVLRLIRAAREPDPNKRFHALAAVLDLDRFLSMVAVETMLCHSDSYSMNRNNYRLYHDPATDKIVFMPHGMDRVLGAHRSTLDLPVVPPPLGLVARAVLTTPEGRRRYVERAGVLFTNLFQPDQLCRRLHEIDAKIAHEKRPGPMDAVFRESTDERRTQDAHILCAKISARAAELKLQFAELPDLLALTPTPQFDANGIARVDGWTPKRRPGQPEVSRETEAQDGKEVLHLRTSNGPLIASLRSKVSLPAGAYRLTGQIRSASSAAPADFIPAVVSIQRYSSVRFGVERQRLDGREINFNFQISEARAPEEIEFICDLRDQSQEVWFDASSLRLVRRGN